MKYQTRKGIVLTLIGGRSVLVAAVSLWGQVPYVTSINDTLAFCWEVLAEGAEEDELVERVLEEFDAQDEELVRSDIKTLLQQLFEQGYLVEA